MVAAHNVPPSWHVDERRNATGVAVPLHRKTGGDYLPLVMGEIVGLMHGRGALLTLHASNGGTPSLLFADKTLAAPDRDAMLHRLTATVRSDFDDDTCFWRDGADEGNAVMIMPVEQQAGHGRLVISVLFDNVTAEERIAAERLYRERRPMAVGYFQLWQQSRMLQQRAQSLEAVLDQTAIGMITISRNNRIVFVNHTAAELLAAGDGIGRSNGALRAMNLTDGINLQAALSHAIAGDEAGLDQAPTRAPLLAFNRKHGPPLVAALLPALSPPVEQGDVAAIMYLVDPQIDTESMLTPLCRLYGLSPVETALVCLLAAGETTASAAQQMHVKEQTARGYLKTIFIKTGTKRQTELVVLMLSSLIRMKRDVLQEALVFKRI